MINENQVIETLKQCFDPEIPVDIWNLGLVYDINILDSNAKDIQNVNITMTLTTPGCHLVEQIKKDVKTKIEAMAGIDKAIINMTFDPRWNVNMVSVEARKKLNL
ncbi:MAG: iron-sulfur cluster assembly protein [Candidatus Neomarinimicrobiota bacterium]